MSSFAFPSILSSAMHRNIKVTKFCVVDTDLPPVARKDGAVNTNVKISKFTGATMVLKTVITTPDEMRWSRIPSHKELVPLKSCLKKGVVTNVNNEEHGGPLGLARRNAMFTDMESKFSAFNAARVECGEAPIEKLSCPGYWGMRADRRKQYMKVQISQTKNIKESIPHLDDIVLDKDAQVGRYYESESEVRESDFIDMSEEENIARRARILAGLRNLIANKDTILRNLGHIDEEEEEEEQEQHEEQHNDTDELPPITNAPKKAMAYYCNTPEDRVALSLSEGCLPVRLVFARRD